MSSEVAHDPTHGGWTRANGGSRRRFNEWAQLLQRFATLVEE